MSIRFPLKTILAANANDEVGAGSTAGGIAYLITIPQDSDGIVVKLMASTVGGGVSAVFQTSDDGGSTWYDVARTSVVSNSPSGPLAEWLTVPTFGFGYRSAVISSTVATGSVIATGPVLIPTGSAGASTLSSKQFSGLPIMSSTNRVFLRITGDLTASSIVTQVMVQQQSATA